MLEITLERPEPFFDPAEFGEMLKLEQARVPLPDSNRETTLYSCISYASQLTKGV